GLVPENMLERAALRLNLAPSPLMMGMWGMGISRTLIAAVQLGVFEALGTEKKSIEEVARITECDRNGMETLLNALNGFGFVKRNQGLYWNRPIVRRWLLSSARFPMTD